MQSAIMAGGGRRTSFLAAALVCVAVIVSASLGAEEMGPAKGQRSMDGAGTTHPGSPSFALFGLPASIEEGRCRPVKAGNNDAKLLAAPDRRGAARTGPAAKRTMAAVADADGYCAALALEYARDGEEISWGGQGREVRLTPNRSYRDRSGLHCREFWLDHAVEGQVSRTQTRACRIASRSWVLQ
ncbi:MAG: hypothetical protein KIT81_01605 [Alphaproteobacteria bacterium]|nr:hypothetical protein [Alphaproteobacteria bacterium]